MMGGDETNGQRPGTGLVAVRWWRGIPEENLRRAMLNLNESFDPEDKKAARVVARIAR